MNKLIFIIAAFVTIISALLFFSIKTNTKSSHKVNLVEAPSAIGTKEDPWKRLNYEIRQLTDPATGRIPDNIHEKEAEFVKSIPTVESVSQKTNYRTKAQLWTLAGPSNVGGRTRALALDVTNENIIIAGGVSGGMWRSENSGLSWSRASHPSAINSVTCVAQDIRSGKENIWYHGTGELRGNSTRAEGAPYRGDGIFKSTDGAKTWDVLSSTTSGKEAEFNSAFNYVWNIATNPTRPDVDEVYAAVYGGIIHSQDGGNSWQTVLGANLINRPDGTDLNQSGASFYTNVMITPSGTMYATLSVFTALGNNVINKGVFRSTNGINWTNITPAGFARFHQRIVMDYAPGNENIVYFAVDNDDLEIWKYNNSNASWQNLSANAPDFEGELGSFDTQGGYNMVIAVHPENPDIVFVGGTNLYRTTDGFSTSSNNSWIGGYDPEGSSNEYEGHHPDQHALVFYPSNPDKMISANDGGLMITLDNKANEPTWVSLNNGYVTSQFYSIAISKESEGIIGGMQDNGTYLKTAPGINQPWNDIFGGDGGFVATTPEDLFWYASFQESQIYRLTLNKQSSLTSFARVDPEGGSGYLFINPYVLDPNNYHRMYMAGGETVWRNNNLSQIPGGKQNPTSVNWDRLDIEEMNTNVTALDISTSPANILYVGTDNGTVMKIENANAGTGKVSTVFNSGGYVVNITIDPSNAQNVFVINSNYNIPSIFYSQNGGETFADVSGNLEEFSDGTGNGPSIRWSEIIPLSGGNYKYFVGTSSGLYSTNILNGGNTVWLKEANETIGNSVIRMMDYRDLDGKFVVATHGNGVFESIIENTLQIEKPIANSQSLVVTNSFPNPFSNHIDIEFEIPEQGPLSVIVLNASGQNIKTLINYPQFAGSVNVRWDGTNTQGQPVKDGMYFYRIFYNGKVTGGKMIYDRQ
ncbi:FlgD immunoglobulin-like domain containing protein [Reichenbachiella sp. MALMAid0571]|uniref:FlgD immunoglobulin-like domain containing protein n=1 Tax=Reichenbachiella sp. MALMAid0571 TaxID=3143939 RepID=UPI0032DF986D